MHGRRIPGSLLPLSCPPYRNTHHTAVLTHWDHHAAAKLRTNTCAWHAPACLRSSHSRPSVCRLIGCDFCADCGRGYRAFRPQPACMHRPTQSPWSVEQPVLSASKVTYARDVLLLPPSWRTVEEAPPRQHSYVRHCLSLPDKDLVSFAVQIQMGSTNIRVGSTIFGARVYAEKPAVV